MLAAVLVLALEPVFAGAVVTAAGFLLAVTGMCAVAFSRP